MKQRLPRPTSSRRNAERERFAAAELCTMLLCHHQALDRERRSDPAYRRQLMKLIDTTLWHFSEAAGKIHGCRYWSTGALRSYEKHKKIVRKQDSPSEMLQHEHLTPKSVMIRYLLSLSNPTVEQVRRVLDEYNIGVVITKEEHGRLSATATPDDPWNRYRQAGVEWVDMEADNR